ncbi:MAG TPA: hypothetical protein PLL53_13560, partial [Saprospiraceae bacterium]|nr:hypothetical protein [Saprospiraceae bacterium]
PTGCPRHKRSLVKYWRIIKSAAGTRSFRLFLLAAAHQDRRIFTKKFASTAKICTFIANKAMTG